MAYNYISRHDRDRELPVKSVAVAFFTVIYFREYLESFHLNALSGIEKVGLT